MLEQTPSRDQADSRDVVEFVRAIAHLAAFAMEGDSEAMRLVTDHLDQMQHRIVMIEDNGIVLLSVDVDDLLAFGDRGKRLAGYLQAFQRLRRRVQLADAAIDENQTRHLQLVFRDALIPPGDDLAHGGEIVDPVDGLDDELAVVALLHLAIFPDDHGCDGLCALDVRDVEALDALRRLGQGERILQCLRNGLRVRLQYAEALVVRLLGIVSGQVDQRTFIAALGNENLDLVPAYFG